jgi:hypothetical protein
LYSVEAEVPAVVPMILMMTMIAVIDFQKGSVNAAIKGYQLLLLIVSTMMENLI